MGLFRLRLALTVRFRGVIIMGKQRRFALWMAFVACGLFVLGSLYYGTDARACTVESKARKIRKALARGNLTAACRAIKQFRRKYPLTPLPPDSPSDDDCANKSNSSGFLH